MYHWWSMWG